MVGVTEAETTQKDDAAASGTKQEDTTLVGTATEEAGAKRAIDDSAEEPAQKEQTPVKEQKVTTGEPRTTRVTKAVC